MASIVALAIILPSLFLIKILFISFSSFSIFTIVVPADINNLRNNICKSN